MAYRFRADESVPQNITRIATELVEDAASLLREAEGEALHEAVHSARKNFKKQRALLRLIRSDIGDDVYRRENDRYRQMGRRLSELRDAEAMVETVDKLAQWTDSAEANRVLAPVREALVAHRERLAAEGTHLRSNVDTVVGELEQARLAIDDWPLKVKGFAALEPGLLKIYRRGRKSFRRAYEQPTGENFHAWRKRVKDYWYHVRLLEDIHSKVMAKYRHKLKRLSDLLGDDHDLVVLGAALGDIEPLQGDTKGQATVLQLLEKRQGQLRDEAHKLGHKLYREKPNAFGKRLFKYWRHWRQDD